MDFDAEELAALLELLSGTDFSYFQYEKGEVRITLTRGDAALPLSTPASDAQAAPRSRTTRPESGASATDALAAPTQAVTADEGPVVQNGPVIPAPMMGTFYAAPRPGEPAFVRPGDAVEPGTVVGIIEVMKLMTPVVAGVSGVISAVQVEDGQFVEFEQPLFRVKTAA